MTEAQGADLVARVGALGQIVGHLASLAQLAVCLLFVLVVAAAVRRW